MIKKKSDKLSLITNGMIANNPTFRLVLGTCPTLAVTTSALNGVYMGLATTFVLICSNVIVSLLRKIIPDKVRIPCYVVLIATFVTVVEMILKYMLPDIYDTLGLYISLIVVNCIILARAEAFASSNPVLDSFCDGLGIGLGFTMSLTIIGIVREFLGSLSFFGLAIPGAEDYAMTVFILPAGGFFVYGFMMVLFNKVVDAVLKRIEEKRMRKFMQEQMTSALSEEKEA